MRLRVDVAALIATFLTIQKATVVTRATCMIVVALTYIPYLPGSRTTVCVLTHKERLERVNLINVTNSEVSAQHKRVTVFAVGIESTVPNTNIRSADIILKSVIILSFGEKL